MVENTDLLTPQKYSKARGMLHSFLESQTSGGLVLLICTIIALLVANVPALQHIQDLWHVKAGVSIGNFKIEMSVEHWINDALMAIFFFVVGLEIKREILVGELSSREKALLPIIGACGGMAIPVLLFWLVGRAIRALACIAFALLLVPAANGQGLFEEMERMMEESQRQMQQRMQQMRRGGGFRR